MKHLKLMAIAAAAVAAMTGAPSTNRPNFAPQAQLLGWGGGRRKGISSSGKNGVARRAGIPKAFRQYCRRYHGTLA